MSVAVARWYPPKLNSVGVDLGPSFVWWVWNSTGRVVAQFYFQVTHQDNSFTIGNMPVGTYTLIACHEMYGPMGFYSTNCRFRAILSPFTSTTL